MELIEKKPHIIKVIGLYVFFIFSLISEGILFNTIFIDKDFKLLNILAALFYLLIIIYTVIRFYRRKKFNKRMYNLMHESSVLVRYDYMYKEDDTVTTALQKISGSMHIPKPDRDQASAILALMDKAEVLGL